MSYWNDITTSPPPLNLEIDAWMNGRYVRSVRNATTEAGGKSVWQIRINGVWSNIPGTPSHWTFSDLAEIDRYGDLGGPVPSRDSAVASAFWRAYALGLLDGANEAPELTQEAEFRAFTAGLRRREVEKNLPCVLTRK